jgi:hypothetical protein
MKLIVFFLLLIFSISVQGQELLSKIPLQEKHIHQVQGVAIGDSVFLFFKYYNLGFQSFLIRPGEPARGFGYIELINKIILGVNQSSDSLYFRFLEDSKKNVIVKTLAVSRQTGRRSLLPGQVIIKENILDRYEDEDLHLVTINPADSTLNFKYFVKNNLITKYQYKLPGSVIKKRSVAFLREGEKVSPAFAQALTKIYCTAQEIIIVEDAVGASGARKPFGTTVTRIKRSTGEMERKFFEETSMQKFSTFFLGEELFKVMRKKGLILTTIKWDGDSNLYTIDKTSAFQGEMSYMRNEVHKNVMDNRNVWDAIDNMADVFVGAYPINDSSIYLKLGTHKEVQLGAPVPTLIGGPLIFMSALFIVKAATIALDDGQSVDHYFYLKRDSDGFHYVQKTDLLEQKIDYYEMIDLKNPIEHKFKGYIVTPQCIIGIYLKHKSKELEVVRFSR